MYVELYRKASEFASQEMGYIFQLADWTEDMIATPVEEANLASILRQLSLAPQLDVESNSSVDDEPLPTSVLSQTESKPSSTRVNAFWTNRLTHFPAYTTNNNLLSFRNNLPSASQKNEFLRQIEQHLVRVIILIFFILIHSGCYCDWRYRIW